MLPKKEAQDYIIPYIIEEDGISPAQRKSWARLIQKIYEVDPSTCPKCQGSMKIISFIKREDLIKKILKHVGLWEVKSVSTELAEVRPQPKIHSNPGRFLNVIETFPKLHDLLELNSFIEKPSMN